MPPRLFHFNCKHCNKYRQTYDKSMQFCSTICQGRFNYYEKLAPISQMVRTQKSKLKSHILYQCKNCGKETSNRKYCSHGCKKLLFNKTKREQRKSKDLFLKEKNKMKYTFDQLNKMADWKLKNDDEKWLKKFNAERM